MLNAMSSFELKLPPNLYSFLVVVYWLGVVAYYSGCSTNHSSNCSNYFDYPSNLSPDSDSDYDSDFGTYYGMCYPHTSPGAVDSTDSHTELVLLSFVPTGSL